MLYICPCGGGGLEYNNFATVITTASFIYHISPNSSVMESMYAPSTVMKLN